MIIRHSERFGLILPANCARVGGRVLPLCLWELKTLSWVSFITNCFLFACPGLMFITSAFSFSSSPRAGVSVCVVWGLVWAVIWACFACPIQSTITKMKYNTATRYSGPTSECGYLINYVIAVIASYEKVCDLDVSYTRTCHWRSHVHASGHI